MVRVSGSIPVPPMVDFQNFQGSMNKKKKIGFSSGIIGFLRSSAGVPG